MDIKKVRERVVYIFNRFPQAINSDDILLGIYIDIFHTIPRRCPLYDGEILANYLIGNKICTATIFRHGRKLREKYPERYKRNEEVEKQCMLKCSAFAEEFRPR